MITVLTLSVSYPHFIDLWHTWNYIHTTYMHMWKGYTTLSLSSALKKVHLCIIYSILHCSPLLGNGISRQTSEGPDLLSPNLRPRHQELIPTPCGPVSSRRRHNAEPIVVLKVKVKFSFLHRVIFIETVTHSVGVLFLNCYIHSGK